MNKHGKMLMVFTDRVHRNLCNEEYFLPLALEGMWEHNNNRERASKSMHFGDVVGIARHQHFYFTCTLELKSLYRNTS